MILQPQGLFQEYQLTEQDKLDLERLLQSPLLKAHLNNIGVNKVLSYLKYMSNDPVEEAYVRGQVYLIHQLLSGDFV